jgi:hypothetical protein
LGATVTITLAQAGHMAATQVPLGAIRDVGKGAGVWVLRDGTAPSVHGARSILPRWPRKPRPSTPG